tara:strand:- start:1999 stop:2283 length:285 start_codon:yes stop_codon:yes gene_type:complete
VIQMRQTVVAWELDGSRLYILWDAQVRDSFQSLPYRNMMEIQRAIMGMEHQWRVDGFDVDKTFVKVLNPTRDHQAWQFDYEPKLGANAIVFTLI